MSEFMGSYRYFEDQDVHVLDCAGPIDVPLGLARLRELVEALSARPACDGVHRLLIDFRQTEWTNEEAHRELSRATRRDFGLNSENPLVRMAFVVRDGGGVVSSAERWFDDENQALVWLTGRSDVKADRDNWD